jgi:transcriptional regulator with PAS, ATPase and Fis domain
MLLARKEKSGSDSATNLESAIADGKFRADLYYRLLCVNWHIPPLRDRSEGVASLP